jgi:hypothetical protein
MGDHHDAFCSIQHSIGNGVSRPLGQTMKRARHMFQQRSRPMVLGLAPGCEETRRDEEDQRIPGDSGQREIPGCSTSLRFAQEWRGWPAAPRVCPRPNQSSSALTGI